MSAKAQFTPESYLRSLAQVVSAAEVQKFIERSPDHHHYKWDYLAALIRPIESAQFPRKSLSDLNFALSNLLIQLDDEGSLKSSSRLYLASLYIYVSQVQRGGSQLQDTAIRLALESLVDSEDRDRLELFQEFLRWLLSREVAHSDAESYFIRLGIAIARGQISEVDDSELREIEANLPSWVRGTKEVRLLSNDPKFSESWGRLLRKIRIRERIRPLLGLS
jgi:hypothetical protein